MSGLTKVILTGLLYLACGTFMYFFIQAVGGALWQR